MLVAGIALFWACSSDDSDPKGNDSGVGQTPQDSSIDIATGGTAGGGGTAGSEGGDACFWTYVNPGCGENAPAPICKEYPGGDACALPYCSCEGVTFAGCGDFSMPFAHAGPCEADGGPDADASEDADACVWLYDLPGCGSSAPPPVCTNGTDDACTLPFCGCDGVTFMGGCGKSNVPFAAYGPCQGDGG